MANLFKFVWCTFYDSVFLYWTRFLLLQNSQFSCFKINIVLFKNNRYHILLFKKIFTYSCLYVSLLWTWLYVIQLLCRESKLKNGWCPERNRNSDVRRECKRRRWRYCKRWWNPSLSRKSDYVVPLAATIFIHHYSLRGHVGSFARARVHRTAHQTPMNRDHLENRIEVCLSHWFPPRLASSFEGFRENA